MMTLEQALKADEITAQEAYEDLDKLANLLYEFRLLNPHTFEFFNQNCVNQATFNNALDALSIAVDEVNELAIETDPPLPTPEQILEIKERNNQTVKHARKWTLIDNFLFGTFFTSLIGAGIAATVAIASWGLNEMAKGGADISGGRVNFSRVGNAANGAIAVGLAGLAGCAVAGLGLSIVKVRNENG
ncbi:hypothetical protein [Fischerella sp. PCC 9605]|uniref:hypothetical protein n=1 Tax=Fischerella sp. PCC 9605 TaxID=1173024 RepID=UPI0004AE84CD|nr:hypothetical protein [Fischerella sp. PCC 9605]